FVASRPAWSAINGLPILSGAFGIWRRDVVVAVGGYTPGHLGEDLDLTMRAHRYLRDAGQDYRLVYSPAAVVWTEVPPTRKILRRQRIRWHRGLMTAVRDFRSTTFNPRHGTIGMVTWPSMVLFEYLAPIVEFCGWLAIPLALLTGAVPWLTAAAFFVLAILAGAITSLVALLLDERFGYFNDPRAALRCGRTPGDPGRRQHPQGGVCVRWGSRTVRRAPAAAGVPPAVLGGKRGWPRVAGGAGGRGCVGRPTDPLTGPNGAGGPR